MPIYEYICESCRKPFEKLVVGEEAVFCPNCDSGTISKQYSRFGMAGSTTKSNYDSLPIYKGGGCGCTPSTCGCKN